MPHVLAMQPTGRVCGSILPPGSKSITNRALVCAALASGSSRLTGALASDDTHYMLAGLQALGIAASHDVAAAEMQVRGCGGRIPASEAHLFVGNSGTTLRFLTAVCTLGQGRYRLDGVERMRQRPVQDLLTALRQLGGDAVSELHSGAPPVVVRGCGLAGGTARIAGHISSQFLSGLLLAAPCAQSTVTIQLHGPLVSQPYVDMTLRVMRQFGADVRREGAAFRVAAPRPYQSCSYRIEPDATAASYFWGAAAITGGRVLVRGLHRQALQGDVAFCDCLQSMGCLVEETAEGLAVTGRPLHGIRVNMNGISDTVQTLAAVALFAEGETVIEGVEHIRHKETDRLRDLATELRKAGAGIDEFPDGLRIVPQPLRGTTFDTYDDHRMAMSLALIGLRQPGILIHDPQCTSKTYPHFFDDLRQLTQASA